jgi:hypothetical protein
MRPTEQETTTAHALLCAAVVRHLAMESAYLEEIRCCVLEWPDSLAPSLRCDVVGRQLAALESKRDALRVDRERLLIELQLAFARPEARRFSAFPWAAAEQDHLAASLTQVRGSIARMRGAVRASCRTLVQWSESVTRLLAGLMRSDPRAVRYTASGARVAAPEHVSNF